jgi:hypothetical protein
LPFYARHTLTFTPNLFHSTAQQNPKNVTTAETITITCTTCYILGNATVQLAANGNLNITEAFDTIVNETKADFKEILSTAVYYVEDTLEAMAKSGKLNLDDFQAPTMSNITFNLDAQSNPQSLLQLQFDGLELYAQLDAMLDVTASYTVNLYTSETPLGLTVPDMDVGVWFAFDLILDADANIDMSSGFHIKFADGIQISIPIFAADATDITL